MSKTFTEAIAEALAKRPVDRKAVLEWTWCMLSSQLREADHAADQLVAAVAAGGPASAGELETHSRELQKLRSLVSLAARAIDDRALGARLLREAYGLGPEKAPASNRLFMFSARDTGAVPFADSLADNVEH